MSIINNNIQKVRQRFSKDPNMYRMSLSGRFIFPFGRADIWDLFRKMD